MSSKCDHQAPPGGETEKKRIMAQKPKTTNMTLWDAVQQTDPNYTKEFNRGGGFRGTAINPIYIARRATEVFGPVGKGWGVEILDEDLMEGAPLFNGTGQVIGRETIHKLRVRLWYVLNGETYGVVQFGQTTFVGKNKYGLFTDEEAPKKSLTDGMTKCLSLLGFSADVYMGRYDDNKYINDLRQQQNGEKARGGEMSGPLNITQLKAALRQLAGHLEAVTDVDELNGIVNDNIDVINQCQRDLPEWFYGRPGSDVTGLQDRISSLTEKLSSRTTPDGDVVNSLQ